jgi:hypothetical protein
MPASDPRCVTHSGRSPSWAKNCNQFVLLLETRKKNQRSKLVNAATPTRRAIHSDVSRIMAIRHAVRENRLSDRTP